MDQLDGLRLFTIAMAIIALLMTSALSQQFHQKGKGGSGYPVDTAPKVDEKAYKAALDRIPVPDKPFDPWGIVHSSEPAPAGRKSN